MMDRSKMPEYFHYLDVGIPYPWSSSPTTTYHPHSQPRYIPVHVCHYSVKREEMSKLEDIAVAEEKKLELAEQCLEEDAQLFDEYLKVCIYPPFF